MTDDLESLVPYIDGASAVREIEAEIAVGRTMAAKMENQKNVSGVVLCCAVIARLEAVRDRVEHP